MKKERKIAVRYARESDTDALVAISMEQWAVIYMEYRKELGDTLYETTHKDNLKKKETAIRTSVANGYCLVAECEDEVCGFCTYRTDGTVGIISNNAVSSAYKGNGIAGKLYDRVFEILRERGCIAVKVTTGLDDVHMPARRAYEKAGFSKGLEQITYFKML